MMATITKKIDFLISTVGDIKKGFFKELKEIKDEIREVKKEGEDPVDEFMRNHEEETREFEEQFGEKETEEELEEVSEELAAARETQIDDYANLLFEGSVEIEKDADDVVLMGALAKILSNAMNDDGDLDEEDVEALQFDEDDIAVARVRKEELLALIEEDYSGTDHYQKMIQLAEELTEEEEV